MSFAIQICPLGAYSSVEVAAHRASQIPGVKRKKMQKFAVRPTTTVGKMKELKANTGQGIFPVVDLNEHYCGLIFAADFDKYPNAKDAGEVLEEARKAGEARNIYVYSTDTLDKARVVMGQKDVPFVPVVDLTHHYVGTLDRSAA